MSLHLGVKEAAEAIRHTVSEATLPPEASHQLKFLQGVCAELGLDVAVPENLNRVALALKHHDIAIHSGEEYPMHVTRLWDGADCIANSAEEADKIINEPPPEPAVKPEPSFSKSGGDVEQEAAKDDKWLEKTAKDASSDTVQFEQDAKKPGTKLPDAPGFVNEGDKSKSKRPL